MQEHGQARPVMRFQAARIHPFRKLQNQLQFGDYVNIGLYSRYPPMAKLAILGSLTNTAAMKPRGFLYLNVYGSKYTVRVKMTKTCPSDIEGRLREPFRRPFIGNMETPLVFFTTKQ